MAERIRFFCPECDRGLSVPPEHAGKRIKCPQCAEAIVVPSEGETALIEQAASEKTPGRTCPSCSAALASEAVLCVQCGLDLRTGKKLASAVSQDKPAAPTANPLLKGVSPAARKWYAPKVTQPPARVLRCEKCAQEFWINNDSTFLSWKEIIDELQKRGTDVRNLPSGRHLFCDAVACAFFEALPAENAEAERRRNLDRLQRAADDPRREWICLSCGAANTYGAPAAYSLDVAVEDLLDVLVSVFETLLKTEFRLQLGSEAEGRPKIYLSYHQHDPPFYVRDFIAPLGDVRSLTVPKATGAELTLEASKVIWLSKQACVATGACNNAVVKLQLVRKAGRWQAKEMWSLFESYRLHGLVRELYDLYGPVVLKVLGVDVGNQTRVSRGKDRDD
ncbi:MAG: hypothetical protein HYR84_02010 [Planctomycetes bacterium]|nr:hypothetical protein [Planctomycetota bacterium]